MKLKLLALAACLAAFAVPAAPAAADEAIPGICYEITLPFGTIRTYECECLAGLQGVEISPPPPTITITVCHARIGNGG